MWLLIIGILAIVIFVIFYIRSKRLKLPNVYLVTGGVKTGKSFLSVCLAVKQYKRNLRYVKFQNLILTILRKQKKELPILISNMHLRNVNYTLLTTDIIERKVRIPYKSVLLVDEASLLADSMSFKKANKVNDLLNEQLNLFVKLIGHETHGGTLIFNTQCIKDVHYGIKRGLQSYLWIHSRTKMPFVSCFKVREMVYSSENDSANQFNEDVEESTKSLWCLNKWYKYYDCYCYSIFTDHLDVYQNNQYKEKKESCKTNVIVSFQEYQTLKNFYQNNKEREEKEIGKQENE